MSEEEIETCYWCEVEIPKDQIFTWMNTELVCDNCANEKDHGEHDG